MNHRGENLHSLADEKSGEHALDWAVNFGAATRVTFETAARVRRIHCRRIGACLGGLACLLLVGLFYRSALFRRAGNPGSEAASRASPAFASYPRTQVLPDGSVVELRGDSRITFNFTPNFRRVSLVSGMADFQVAKNPRRPFIVSAGGVDVRAVGTVFSVQLGASDVEVLVTEGRVAVDKQELGEEAAEQARNESSPPPVLLAAGHRVVVGRDRSVGAASVETVSTTAIAEELSWRVPRLTLSGTTLSDVIPVMNKYGSVRITLADPALASLQLSGSLRADNTSSFLGILELQFGIKADTKSSEIILHR